MDHVTQQWHGAPRPSCSGVMGYKFSAVQLVDGRLWFFCPKEGVALIFDGKSFISSGLLPWSGLTPPGYEIIHQGLALVNDNQVLIAGGYTFYNSTTFNNVYVMDVKEQVNPLFFKFIIHGLGTFGRYRKWPDS